MLWKKIENYSSLRILAMYVRICKCDESSTFKCAVDVHRVDIVQSRNDNIIHIKIFT